MSEQLKESMSAVFDDEADAFELRRVLDEAAGNDELRAHWHRLALIGDVIRSDHTQLDHGLRDRIFAELKAEGTLEVETAPQLHSIEGGSPEKAPKNWLGRVTGIAVATAAAVLVMVNGGLFTDDSSFSTGPDNFAGAANNNAELVPVMYSQATAADQQRQYGFILRHIQQNAMNSNGMTGFAKMATFQRAPAGAQSLPNSSEEDDLQTGSNTRSNALEADD
ncbi:MAG: sigma-E factor negative regulatory protein [Pseudomonadota bacterium]